MYLGLLKTGIPVLGPAFGNALAVTAAVLTFASVLYFKAIKYADLSLAIPMMAFTPMFLLISSPLILGELPGGMSVVGIVLSVGGSYILHFRDRSIGCFEPFKSLIREKGPRYMLCVAAIYSISANMDKIGVMNSSPLMWIASVNSLLALTFGLIVIRRNLKFLEQIKTVWPFLILIGLCNAAAAIFQMTAVKMTLVPYLIAVKRTSIVMSSLFGFIFFKEKGIRERLAGVALMVAGVFMIYFYK